MKKYIGFAWWCYGASLIFVALIFYGVLIEPNQIEVHHVSIWDSHLGRVLKNKIVVQLSDLHISTIGKREQAVLKQLDELDPDIILLTGDYVAWGGDYEPALKFISKLHAKIGVWAVMGDYDYSNSRKSCLFCHEAGNGKPTRRHSVHFLRNNLITIDFPEGPIGIAGLDGERSRLASIDTKLVRPSKEMPLIVLSHSPLNFDLISDNESLFVLAGDTHGGQVPVPSWLFALIGYDKNASYNEGLFKQGQKTLFVSRGIGTSHLPIRLFRQPEVVVFYFQE